MSSYKMRLGFRRPCFAWLAAAAATALAGPLAAAPPEGLPAPILVADYSPGQSVASFVPRQLASIGGLLYFVGRDPQHGEEPWVTDGTPAGTRRLADLCPGTCDSYARDFTAVGGRVVFSSYAQRRIYAVDAGEVVELADGAGPDFGFEALGNIAYFRSGSAGSRMQRTDGTVDGTGETADFCNHEPCEGPSYFQAVNGAVYFTQGGTLAALFAEGDRRALAALDHAQEFTALDAERVIFEGCRSTGCAAWVSDGTPGGTRPLEADVQPATYGPRHFVAWRGGIYFTSPAGEMKSTDGTPGGTLLEPSFAGSKPTPLAANTSHLLYTVEVPGEVFREDLLRARGAGGSDLPLLQSPNIRPEGGNGDTLYFMASSTLTATDGTPAGTHPLYEVYGSSPGVSFGGDYVFGLDPNGSPLDGGLWRSDGTFGGTARIDLGMRFPNGTWGGVFGMASFLVASLGSGGGLDDDLYRLAPLTFELTDTDDARRLYPLKKGVTLLYAVDRANGQLVAVTTGASVPLPGAGQVLESALAAGDRLYYTRNTPGQQLFETDGTVAGTRELFDLRPGYVPACSGHHCEPSFPQGITPSGSKVYFVAPATGGEDGGTALWAASPGAAPRELLRLDEPFFRMAAAPGGRVIFESRLGLEPGDAPRLWSSDGTAAGTRPFFQLPGRSNTESYTQAGGRVFFTLPHPGGEDSLWITDLTAAGTYRLAGAPGMSIAGMLAADDRLFFTGIPAAGEEAELGYSDGTPAGTRWLDLVPGKRGSLPGDLRLTFDRRVVFTASGDGAGQELWISDGTRAGTYRLTDLAPGPAASSPSGIATFGSRVFFNASDGVVGFELWALDLLPSRPVCPLNQLCLRNDRFEVAATAFVPQPGGQIRAHIGRRALGTAESGGFYFFSVDNWELLVKVLDGCHLNDSFWVFSAAASDLAYQLRVTDRATGQTRTWDVPAGSDGPLLDTAGFAGCDADGVPEIHTAAIFPANLAPRCADDPEALCLGGEPDLGVEGRFRVRLDWRTADGAGRAHPIAEGSADTGLFTFFSPSNWEMMVKVLDGCAINGKFWVFGAGTTDVGWTLTVTDRTTQQQKVYQSPVGQPSATLTDSEAFSCQP